MMIGQIQFQIHRALLRETKYSYALTDLVGKNFKFYRAYHTEVVQFQRGASGVARSGGTQ